ncbi:hypothetical protein QBC45DRAFT_340516, partial [Copromyces sp. CBS 386.78]
GPNVATPEAKFRTYGPFPHAIATLPGFVLGSSSANRVFGPACLTRRNMPNSMLLLE